MLSESKAADRRQMADAVVALARRYGLTANEVQHPADEPNARPVDIEGPHGLKCTVTLKGQKGRIYTHCDSWVVSWYGVELPYRLSAFGDHTNTVHGSKATTCADGFPVLLNKLERDFSRIKEGRAFEPLPTWATWEAAATAAGWRVVPEIPGWAAPCPKPGTLYRYLRSVESYDPARDYKREGWNIPYRLADSWEAGARMDGLTITAGTL